MNLQVTVESSQDLGTRYQDVLEVVGTVGHEGQDDAQEISAHGWVSATTHYYPPEDYDENGNLIEGATPRNMTDEEKQAYYVSLLTAAYNGLPPQ